MNVFLRASSVRMELVVSECFTAVEDALQMVMKKVSHVSGMASTKLSSEWL
jgi:hypothetical protein